MLKLLDCTLRDGGYYNNWNYPEGTLTGYFKYLNTLPVDFVEIGYRSLRADQYLGELYYTPLYILQKAEMLMPDIRKAIMLDEKDTTLNDLDILLDPCRGLVSLVRIAVAPDRLKKGIALAKAARDKGFLTALNLMYASEWLNDKILIDRIKKEVAHLDYFYLVDSYGSLYPDDIKKLMAALKPGMDIPMGFHGHNNLELALINSLTAIDCGCEIIDATITGMGRGAGNLKMELALIALKEKYGYELDFDSLASLTSLFHDLQKKYDWGTNIAYMLSGAYSIPQKEVMAQMNKHRHFIGTIIQGWDDTYSANGNGHTEKKTEYPNLESQFTADEVIITGGGPSAIEQMEAFRRFVNIKSAAKVNLGIIHSSTRFADEFHKACTLPQYFCLVGKEGKRLESFAGSADIIRDNRFIVPSGKSRSGTYIPASLKYHVLQCAEPGFAPVAGDSPLALAIQAALDLNAQTIYLYGFDGYTLQNDQAQVDLFYENQQILDKAAEKGIELVSLTPTRYQHVQQASIFYIITKLSV